MKNLFKVLGIIALVALIGFSVVGCGGEDDPNNNNNNNNNGGGDVAVAWTGLTANGTANTTDTTSLTLTFDRDPVGLAIDNVTVTGATKGTLSASGATRTLTISNITIAQGANVTVGLTNPSGYAITPTSRTAAINKGISVTSITINKTGILFFQNNLLLAADDTVRIYANIAPGSVSNKAVIWTISTNVATVTNKGAVDYGNFNIAADVTGINAGTATIKVTTEDGGFEDECTVIISAAGTPGLAYTTLGSGTSSTAEVNKGTVTSGAVVIPATHGGLPVTVIGDFHGLSGITSIDIPNSVKSIEGLSSTGLTSVTIPDSVTSIANDAFNNCDSLASVTIGSGVTSIGSQAFYSESLTSVTFEGTIASSNFNSIAFYGLGDLRDKYLAAGGGIGTYTRSGTGTGGDPYIWTKQ